MSTETKKQRKRTISYIINTTDHELMGHHSLGVNSLQYDRERDILVSGGRDGVVSLWEPGKVEDAINPFPSKEDFDSGYDDSEKIKQYIWDNLDNEDEIVRLEGSITGNPLARSWPKASDYRLRDKCHQHLDWINDLKILRADQLVLASCSNDLSVKIWNTQGEHLQTSTLGYHDDYVQSLGYTGGGSHDHQLVSGGLDKTIKVWDLVKGRCLQSYEFQQEKGSVYSVDCYGNYIISGGPTNVISLFDRRDMHKPIKQFLGHTDTIRCLKLGSKSFLSGSSDTTVRLWDLRTNRVMRNFDMHDSSVWSLCVPNVGENEDPSFDVFYSGDRSGLVIKTDLRASDLDPDSTKRDYFNDKVNASLGVSTVVATIGQDNLSTGGVLSIVEGDGSLWTASAVSKDSFISRWALPKTSQLVLYQGIKLYRNLELLGRGGTAVAAAEETQVPSPSDVIHRAGSSGAFSMTSLSNENALDIVSQFSHDDMNQIDEALTSQFTLNNSPDFDGVSTDGEEDSHGRLETYFLSLAGGPNTEYVLSKEGTPEEGHGLDITYEKIPERFVTVVPFNSKALQTIEGSDGLIKARMLNNRRHVATMDQNGCIYIIDVISGKLVKKVVTITEEKVSENSESSSFLDMADRFEDITDNFQTEESLPQWCSVQTKGGMLFITLQESTFTNCEVYSDDFAEAYPEDLCAVPTSEPSRYNLGKTVLRSLLSDFANELFSKKEVELREKRSLIRNKDAAKENAAAGQAASEVSQPTSKKGMWRSRPKSKDTTPTPPSSADKHKKKFFRMSHHHHHQEDTPPSQPSSSQSHSEPNKEAPSSEQPKTAKDVENKKLTDEIQKLSSTEELLDWMDEKGMKGPDTSSSSPEFQYDGKILLTVNENIRTYGNDTKTLFLTHIRNIKPNVDKFEEFLPVWVARAILLGRYPHKDVPKVSFVVTPDQSLADLKPMESTNRLTAYSLLRVGKVIEYINEKLPEEDGDLDLELLCRNRILPDRATLNTIKTRIWKSSSDVELVFRRRGGQRGSDESDKHDGAVSKGRQAQQDRQVEHSPDIEPAQQIEQVVS
ncbi:DEKNAAC103034 [Brettanomyces naardenensis]|uniref:DEKNAAC103034 n=1 Tax=Brettanomyces naardenensis TaxID=13370 RepID=A0A448YMF7_BRENA|nr:DEKNAAC103034 [Brettanomyces naardenensis]